jgi:hypothetical protein
VETYILHTPIYREYIQSSRGRREPRTVEIRRPYTTMQATEETRPPLEEIETLRGSPTMMEKSICFFICINL